MLTEILRQDSQARIFHQLAVVALLVRVLSSACQATGDTLVITRLHGGLAASEAYVCIKSRWGNGRSLGDVEGIELTRNQSHGGNRRSWYLQQTRRWFERFWLTEERMTNASLRGSFGGSNMNGNTRTIVWETRL